MNEAVQQRDVNIDNAKGLAAIIVVIGHFIEMTVFKNTSLGSQLDFLCYTLHVPSFLFCSGYLFRYTLNKHSIREILVTKLLDNMIVWMLWGTVLLLTNYIVDRYVFGEIYPLIDCVKYSFNQLWYFWFLFVCCFVTLIIAQLNMPKMLISLLLIVMVFGFSFINVSVDKLMVHYLMFFIGFCIEKSWMQKLSWIVYVYIALIISAFLLGINITNLFDTWYSTLFTFVIKMMGSWIPYTLFAIGIKHGFRNHLFEMLGKGTLFIYIFHFFVLAFYRRLYIESYLVMVLFIIVAVVFSLFIKKIIETFSIEYIVQPSLLLKRKIIKKYHCE